VPARVRSFSRAQAINFHCTRSIQQVKLPEKGEKAAEVRGAGGRLGAAAAAATAACSACDGGSRDACECKYRARRATRPATLRIDLVASDLFLGCKFAAAAVAADLNARLLCCEHSSARAALSAAAVSAKVSAALPAPFRYCARRILINQRPYSCHNGRAEILVERAPVQFHSVP
jgi:hypothetical protein